MNGSVRTSQTGTIVTIGPHPDLKKPGGVVTHMRFVRDLKTLPNVEPVDVGSYHGTAALEGRWVVARILSNIRALGRRLRKGDVRLVMVQQSIDWAPLIKGMLILLSIPSDLRSHTLVFFHGGRFESVRPMRLPMVRRFVHRLFQRVRCFYFLSPPERRGFEALFPDLPTAAFANYADSNDLLEPLPRTDQTFRLLFVGRVERVKGIFELVEAVRRLTQDGNTEVSLTIVGTGKDLEALQAEASDLKEQVRFTGFLHGDDLVDAYRAADVFALPTTHPEGFPYVVIEAMRVGLPLVTTAEGILETLVEDGVTGFQVPANDPDALVRAFRRLMDPELRARIVQNNRAYFTDHLAKHRAEVFYGELLREMGRSIEKAPVQVEI